MAGVPAGPALPSPAPLVFAVTSMQSPVWSPVSFCHPSHFLEALDPHWGPEFSDITPKALAQPRSCPPHRQMPSQDSLGHHLPLPVPVGAATSGVPEFLFILGPFFARRGSTGAIFQERDRRQETRKRPQPLALADQALYGLLLGTCPSDHSLQGSHGDLQKGQPRSHCLLSQICAPELD